MMNLRIIKAGILDTVQDLGRFGYQDLGINPGGLMDSFSGRLANALVGNALDKPVLELNFPASTFFFERSALIAVTGADMKMQVNGEEVPLNHPVWLNRFSIVQFTGISSGTTACIAIRGGLGITPWLGSYSTNLKAHAGGFFGRALRKDDEIPLPALAGMPVHAPEREFEILPWSADVKWGDVTEKVMLMPGCEWEWLEEKDRERMLSGALRVGTRSDRMGYRLEGAGFLTQDRHELVSSGVGYGTIQLLPSGDLIVLMADHQTTGGYPRIAHVISAHHGKFSQLRPGAAVQFEITDAVTAEMLLLRQQQHLEQVREACLFKMETWRR